MDEYPREVAELLSLAKDAYEPPDPDARVRVRQRVAITIASGAALAVATKAVAKGSAQAGLLSSITAKIVVASVAVVTASTIAVTQFDLTRKGAAPTSKSAAHTRAETQTGPEHEAEVSNEALPALGEASAQAPVLNENSAVAVVVDEQPSKASVVVDRQSRSAPKARHTATNTAHASRSTDSVQTAQPLVSDSLREEMRLLQASSEALAEGQTARALAWLDRYRQTFNTPMLGSEYEGLRLIARCQNGEGRARVEAKRWLSRSQKHVLFTRIASACKLEEAK